MGKIVLTSMGEYFKLVDTRRISPEKEKKEEKREGSLPRVRISASKTKRKFNHTRQSPQEIEEVRKTNMEKLNNIEKELYNLQEEGGLL